MNNPDKQKYVTNDIMHDGMLKKMRIFVDERFSFFET